MGGEGDTYSNLLVLWSETWVSIPLLNMFISPCRSGLFEGDSLGSMPIGCSPKGGLSKSLAASWSQEG